LEGKRSSVDALDRLSCYLELRNRATPPLVGVDCPTCGADPVYHGRNETEKVNGILKSISQNIFEGKVLTYPTQEGIIISEKRKERRNKK